MASDKQIAASRANGARSRGPVTPEGKLRSLRNNVVHGLLARTVVLDSESRPRFDALLQSLQDDLQPETAIENLLVHKMAVAHWRQMRVWGIEKLSLSHAALLPESNPGASTCGPVSFGPSHTNMNEYEMRFDRQFSRALDRFERFRDRRTRQLTQTMEKEPGNEPG